MKGNFKIKKIWAREILDSRGEPTVEVDLETDFGVFLASVPSGASKGKYEAVELRDGGKRYQGKGVLRAVRNINEIIAPKLKGEDFCNQKKIDEILISLDGTENKSDLGANAILPVSVACCRAGAFSQNLLLWLHISQLSPLKQSRENCSPESLPRACFNIINGGLHAGNDLDIQEFMIIPQFERFSQNLRLASEIYQTLKEILKEKYGKNSINVGDEGGFAPPISKTREALDLIISALESENLLKEIKLGLDCAASQYKFSEVGSLMIYKIEREEKNLEELLDYYRQLTKDYPIIFLEDPFAEDDFEGFKKIHETLGKEVLIVGDDLLATNIKRMKIAKKKNLCNAMIIKINQIGTVSEAIEVVRLAKTFGWKIIVSHRSGETCDDFISDFAVGISADFIKAGAPARGERVAKYNKLLKIEEELLI